MTKKSLMRKILTKQNFEIKFFDKAKLGPKATKLGFEIDKLAKSKKIKEQSFLEKFKSYLRYMPKQKKPPKPGYFAS